MLCECAIINKLSEISGRLRPFATNLFSEVKFMSVLEIIGGAVLLIACILIICLCLAQDQKSQDSMTAALTGSSADSFYGKNEGRTKEAILNKITRALGIALFVITLAVNIIPIFTNK